MDGWMHGKRHYLKGPLPYDHKSFGGNLYATIICDPATDGAATWRLNRTLSNGKASPIDHGVAASIEEAKRAVEMAVAAYRPKPGRISVCGRPMTSAERNKRQMARLMAMESAAAAETQSLLNLHRDLVVVGLHDWAARVARILRVAALKAVAEYARRNSSSFVRTGPQMPSPEETDARRRRIEDLAEKVDELSVAAAAREDTAGCEEFEAILNELHLVGFFPDNELVSAVARAFYGLHRE